MLLNLLYEGKYMLLVLDIGNTNVCVGCFQGSELLFDIRLKTDTARTSDDYGATLDMLLSKRLKTNYGFSSCVIASVVPQITADFVRLVCDLYKIKPLVINSRTHIGINLNVEEPMAVGADRIVNAVAIKALFGVPGLVIDFGTATTFDYVSKEGNFEGGIICPGLKGSLDSLVKNTAKLPNIEIAWPKTVVGKNTVVSMQAGAVVGYLSMIDALIDCLESEVGKISHIVATGGLGGLMTEHSKKIRTYDPYLTLTGLRIIGEMNGLK